MTNETQTPGEAPDRSGPEPTISYAVPPIPPPGQGASTPAAGSPFWDELHRLGVVRDRNAGWFSGVCAGIAHRLGVDPLLIRALAVVLAMAGGFGVIAYLLAWLLLPDTEGRILLREIGQGSVTGIVLVAVIALMLVSGFSFGQRTWLGGWFVPFAALGIFLLVRGSRRPGDGQAAVPPSAPPPASAAPMAYAVPAAPTTYAAPAASVGGVPSPVGTAQVPAVPAGPPPRPQRRQPPRGTGPIILGLAVAGYGLGHLLAGPLDFRGTGNFLGLLIALGVSSLAALILGLAGRRGGAASVLSLLLLMPVGSVAAYEAGPFGPGKNQTVTWVVSGDGGFNLGVGSATLDLRSLPAPDAGDSRPVVVDASVGAGELIVLVPPGADVRYDISVGLGSIDLGPFAHGAPTADGVGSNRSGTFTAPGTSTSPPVELQLNVGVGQVTFQEK